VSRGGIENKIKDGSLGAAAPSSTGVFCAVGVATNPSGGILILTDPEDAHKKLGDGPLRDTVVSALSLAKGTCYVIALEGTVPGDVSGVTKKGKGAGVVTVAGDPRNEYDIEIIINENGGLNEGLFHYVVDGTPSPRITIPADGVFTIPDTGLTVTFDAGTFLEDDSFSFKCTEPEASNAEILGAVDTLFNSNYIFEWINVAGVSDKTLWAALDAKAAGQEALGRYVYFKCQARYLNQGETVDQWVAALIGIERGLTASTRVQLYAGWVLEADPFGAIDERGCMNLATGMTARRDIHEPVDATAYGAMPGVVEMLPAGINGGHIDALDNAGYTTLCTYYGETGVYITHGRMTAPQTSDFNLEERRRVMDFALAAVKKAQFLYINSNVTVGADGSLEGIDIFQAISEQPLKNMEAEGKISGGMVLIDKGQDILSTQKLITKVKIRPLGKMSWIENEFAFYNPNLTGGK